MKSKLRPKAELNIEFGKRIAGLLDELGATTREDRAARLDIHPNSYDNYVKGRVPEWNILLGMARYFGVSVDYLLTGQSPASVTLPEIRRASRPMDLTPPSKAVTEILGKAWDVLEQDKAAAVAVTSVVEMAYAQLKSPERAAPESNAGEDTRSALKTG